MAAPPRSAASGVRHLDPALRLWWRELEKGVRTVRTYDTLWHAACWEAGARELDAQGSEEIAARCRATARQVIRDAAGKRAAA